MRGSGERQGCGRSASHGRRGRSGVPIRVVGESDGSVRVRESDGFHLLTKWRRLEIRLAS
jgi:hypothetical protein